MCDYSFVCMHSHIQPSLVAQLVNNPPAKQETPVQFLGQKFTWRRNRVPTPIFLDFSDGSESKESACVWETWVQSLVWEDPLEEGMATHSSILAWRNPMDREACGLGESHITEQLSIAQTRCSCPHCLRIRHQHSCHQRHLDHWSFLLDQSCHSHRNH